MDNNTPQQQNIPQEEKDLLADLRNNRRKKVRIEHSEKRVLNFPPALPLAMFQEVVDVIHGYGIPTLHSFPRVIQAKDHQGSDVFRKKSNTQSATYNNGNSSFIVNSVSLLEVI
jgi:hypothetical protein